MIRDPTGCSKDSKEHSLNKACFKEYIELFSSGRIAIAMKEEQYAANAPQHTPPAQVTPPAQHLTTTEHAAPTQQAGTSQHASTSSLRSLLAGQKMPNQRSLTNALWSMHMHGQNPTSSNCLCPSRQQRTQPQPSHTCLQHPPSHTRLCPVRSMTAHSWQRQYNLRRQILQAC
ncbi:hypothetical protein F7725_021534 [Dissostichus mawsoni]|uniref:Uncharacterized protein n=1 Tax=Dissostichus mawsoni TaxID=36200 RepID=A0A7J5ZBH1_DISMA|nr:hypothetical protein F7725_021534 [Dissostichus mawsoni]